MPARRNTPPKQSVFASNPATSSPFISPEHAKRVIMKNIQLKHRGLLGYVEIEDLVQDSLTRLVLLEYDPEKSAPKTFIIMVSDSAAWARWRYMHNSGRELVVQDFNIRDEFDNELRVTETSSTDITPEEIYLAKETVNEFYKQQERLPEDKRRKSPVGFVPYRPMRSKSNV